MWVERAVREQQAAHRVAHLIGDVYLQFTVGDNDLAAARQHEQLLLAHERQPLVQHPVRLVAVWGAEGRP